MKVASVHHSSPIGLLVSVPKTNCAPRQPHVVDIVPTVLELAGVQKPKEWKGEPIPDAPGHSLVPAFAKNETIARDSLWWLHEGNSAIRVGDYKLVAAKDDPGTL